MEGTAITTSDYWVLDASWESEQDGVYCFYPYNKEEEVVSTGLTFLSDIPPGRLVAVYHEDGVEEAEKWTRENEHVLREIVRKTDERDRVD
jgi:hypothetical protein